MKKYIVENKSFTISVIDYAKDGKPLQCRNGHEVGDTYVCEYGCPAPVNGCGGFCTKSAISLYRLKEVVYANGDLRLLGFKNNHDIEFPCPDGAVWFRLQIHDLAEIRPLSAEQLPQYADIIRRSFATVAKDFGWTRENCPSHTSFITDEKLADRIKEGYFQYGFFVGDTIFGFASLTNINDGVYEMNNVSILPEWRHYGYGKRLIDFCKDRVKEYGGTKITIEIVNDNTILKEWYVANGFVYKGISYMNNLPFTVGLMEWTMK